MKADRSKVKIANVVDTVKYVFRRLVNPRVLLSNFVSDPKRLMSMFRLLFLVRPEIEHPLHHITCSPTKKDKISFKKWRRIARRIVEKLNLPPDWPIVIVLHELRGKSPEPHLHILLMLINFAGIRLDPAPSPHQLIKIAAELEVEFGLEITPGLKSKKSGIKFNYHAVKRLEEGKQNKNDLKRIAIYTRVRLALKETVTGEMNDFVAQVHAQKVKVKFFKNDQGEINGIGFKFAGFASAGKKISDELSFNQIQKKLNQQKYKYEKNHPPTMGAAKSKVPKRPQKRSHGRAVKKHVTGIKASVLPTGIKTIPRSGEFNPASEQGNPALPKAAGAPDDSVGRPKKEPGQKDNAFGQSVFNNPPPAPEQPLTGNAVGVGSPAQAARNESDPGPARNVGGDQKPPSRDSDHSRAQNAEGKNGRDKLQSGRAAQQPGNITAAGEGAPGTHQPPPPERKCRNLRTTANTEDGSDRSRRVADAIEPVALECQPAPHAKLTPQRPDSGGTVPAGPISGATAPKVSLPESGLEGGGQPAAADQFAPDHATANLPPGDSEAGNRNSKGNQFTGYRSTSPANQSGGKGGQPVGRNAALEEQSPLAPGSVVEPDQHRQRQPKSASLTPVPAQPETVATGTSNPLPLTDTVEQLELEKENWIQFQYYLGKHCILSAEERQPLRELNYVGFTAAEISQAKDWLANEWTEPPAWLPWRISERRQQLDEAISALKNLEEIKNSVFEK